MMPTNMTIQSTIVGTTEMTCIIDALPTTSIWCAGQVTTTDAAHNMHREVTSEVPLGLPTTVGAITP
jgi:hypothetical protein